MTANNVIIITTSIFKSLTFKRTKQKMTAILKMTNFKSSLPDILV